MKITNDVEYMLALEACERYEQSKTVWQLDAKYRWDPDAFIQRSTPIGMKGNLICRYVSDNGTQAVLQTEADTLHVVSTNLLNRQDIKIVYEEI